MGETSESRRRLVCRCLGVSSPRIFDAIRRGELRSVAEVTKACAAGGGCGTCHPEIEEILADVAGAPVTGSVRLENRLVCEAETRARVEGSLDSLIRPRLAERGVTLELLAIRGLEVRVRLLPPGDAEAVRLVSEKLRKYVCVDLELAVE